jgi:hypothetical protein
MLPIILAFRLSLPAMRFRYTTKEIFVCVALLAAGMGILAFLFGSSPGQVHVHEPLRGWKFALWLASGSFVGAGLLLPFKRPFLGALLGLIALVIASLSMGAVWT